jgi:hypothetical protein
MTEQEQTEGLPMLELRYLDEIAGWIDCASAFLPANEDAVFLNAALLHRYAA